jgi:hypothetical protein
MAIVPTWLTTMNFHHHVPELRVEDRLPSMQFHAAQRSRCPLAFNGRAAPLYRRPLSPSPPVF